MSTTLAELTKDGELKIAGNLNTRLPVVTDGLICHFPFDGRGGSFDGIGGYDTTQNICSNVNLIEICNLDWRDINNWTRYTQTGSIEWDETEQAIKVIDGWWGTFNQWFKIDTNKKWFIEAKVKRTSGSGSFYLGDIAYNIDKSTSGISQKPGTHEYWGASGVAPETDWTLYKNKTIGIDTPRTGSDTTVSNYSTWYTGTEWIKYLFIANYSNAVGIMYIKDLKLYYIDSDTSNCIVTNDGIAVEESTTNLFSNPFLNTDLSGWNEYDNPSKVTNLRRERIDDFHMDNVKYAAAIDISNGGGGGTGFVISGGSHTLGVYYTKSMWVKSSIDNVVVSATYSNISYAGPSITLKAGEWTKIYATHYNETTTQSDSLHFGFSGPSGSNFTIWGTAAQWEAKSFATCTISGSSLASTVGIPIILNSECTINFDYYYEGGVSNTVISNANYNYWWGIFHDATGYIYMHEAHDGTSHNPKNFLQTKNTWATLTIKWNMSTQYFYANGTLLGSIPTVGNTNSSNIPIIYLGTGWNRGNGLFKNLSIYNRMISDNEIKQLSNSSFELKTNGELIISRLISKPNMPGDVYYFPLDINGKDQYRIINPSDDTNVIYDDGYCFVPTEANAKLQYNLNLSIGLDWSSNWTIAYWKMPISTNSGLTGYNIESIGCNSVGDGYIWWGKTSGSNSLSSSTPGTIDPSTYFGNWQFVILRKNGTTLTIDTYLSDSVKSTRTASVSTVLPNYYVTQYGYDLFLGGWDNTNVCNTHFRDLIVVKRSLSDEEVLNIYKNKMEHTNKNILRIQNSIYTGQVL